MKQVSLRQCIYVFACAMSFVYFSGCGDQGAPKKASRSLDIVFLDRNEELPIESIKEIAREFAAQHDDVIVNTTSVVVEPNTPFQDLVRQFRNVDAVFYPSLLEDVIEDHANLFYPITLDIENLPLDVLSHYKAGDEAGYWTVPVYIDPVIMLVQKKAMRIIGDEKFPDNWAKLSLVSEFGHSSLVVSYPNMIIYDVTPFAFEDAIASFYLSRGLFYDQLFGDGLAPEMDLSQHEFTQYQILKTLAHYQAKDPEKIEDTFVRRKTLESYLETMALFIYTRLSEYQKVPIEVKNQIFTGVLPNPNDKNPVLCYSVNTSVSLESDEPELSKDFIEYLVTINSEKENEKNYLSITDWKTSGLFPKNSVMIKRYNSKTLHEKTIIDALKGKKQTLELKDTLLLPYKIIQ